MQEEAEKRRKTLRLCEGIIINTPSANYIKLHTIGVQTTGIEVLREQLIGPYPS